MKISTAAKTAAAITIVSSIGIAGAPIASADYPIVGTLGSELTMTDSVGGVELAWQVSDLRPSTDVMPGYPVAGDLWEATATVRAIRGPVTPGVSQFNAVAPNQAAYRVLWQVASPVNVSGGTIPSGAQSTGKIHFDVTGPPPTTVTMNNGMQDLMIWTPATGAVPPPPPPPPAAPAAAAPSPDQSDYCVRNPVGCHFFGPYGPGS